MSCRADRSIPGLRDAQLSYGSIGDLCLAEQTDRSLVYIICMARVIDYVITITK